MSSNVIVIQPHEAGKRFFVDGVERLVARVGDSAVLATRHNPTTIEIIMGMGGLRVSNNIVLVPSGHMPDGKPAYVTYGSPTGPRAFIHKGEGDYQTVNFQLKKAEYLDVVKKYIHKYFRLDFR